MKLRKLKKTNRLTPNLQLLQFLRYRKLQTTELSLNKLVNVIAKFANNKKKKRKTRILFLGFPNYFSKTFRNSRHLFLPNFMWLNGMISNRNFKYQSKKLATLNDREREFKLSLKQNKKIDLIVVYAVINSSGALKESYLSNIPVVSISKKVSLQNNRALFSSPAIYNYTCGKTKDLFFILSLLKSVLLRGDKSTHYKSSKILPPTNLKVPAASIKSSESNLREF